MTAHMNPHLFVYGSLMSTAGHPMGERLRARGAADRRGHDPGPALSHQLVSGRGRETATPSTRVHGEVYALNNPGAALAWLDAYEGIAPGNREPERVRARRAAGAARLRARRSRPGSISTGRTWPGSASIADGRWTAACRLDESSLAFARALGTIRRTTVCAGRRRPGSREEAHVEPLSRGLRRLEARPARPSGPRPRARSTGTSPGTRCSTPTPASTAAGSWARECNTAWNCLDRHVERGRAQQKALIYDSPVTKTTRAYTYAELRDEVATLGGVLQDLGVEQGRPGDHLHADGARGGDRHAGLRAHRRHPFGGVRRLRRAGAGNPHRRRQAGRHPVGLLRHRARPHRALQAAARRGHRARQAQAADGPDAAAADGGGRP